MEEWKNGLHLKSCFSSRGGQSALPDVLQDPESPGRPTATAAGCTEENEKKKMKSGRTDG